MKRRREIAVELTPLLDVILIMLFMIMLQNGAAAKSAVEKAEAEKAVRAAEMAEMRSAAEKNAAELENALGIIASRDAFEEYAEIVSVTIVNSDGGKRDIYVTAGENTQTVSFGRDSARYGENSFKTILDGIVRSSGETPVFICFSYDSSAVYRRDYDMIASAMEELQSRSNNVYIQFNERTD